MRHYVDPNLYWGKHRDKCWSTSLPYLILIALAGTQHRNTTSLSSHYVACLCRYFFPGGIDLNGSAVVLLQLFRAVYFSSMIPS